MAPSQIMQQNAMIPSFQRILSGFTNSRGVSVALVSLGRRNLKLIAIPNKIIAMIITKWCNGMMPLPIITAPIPAAVKPAKLQKPWKDAMILRPYLTSTPTAWVLMAILDMLPAIPKSKRSPIKKAGVEAKPKHTRLKVYKVNAMAAILLLPNLVTSQPDKGKAIMDPAGSANNTIPSKASERFNCC